MYQWKWLLSFVFLFQHVFLLSLENGGCQHLNLDHNPVGSVIYLFAVSLYISRIDIILERFGLLRTGERTCMKLLSVANNTCVTGYLVITHCHVK